MTTSQIITQARQITGNVIDTAVGETFIADSAIETALAPTIRDITTIYGGSALKEVTFDAAAGQQDYVIAEAVGEDVHEIESVIRSGAYLEGIPSVIPAGYQGDVFDAIINQARARKDSEFAWEIIGEKLRLMPVPTSAEVVSVRYISASYSVDDLPAATATALVFAACVAILNASLNRLMTDRATGNTFSPASEARIKTIIAQRDYYQDQYEREIRKL